MWDLTTSTILLSLLSGAIVGFVLGLIGGGGSILALPLLVYVVGYGSDAHVAIGTSALAVAVSALANLVHHGRNGNVDVAAGLWFALPGVAGALLGAALGLATVGEHLLFLFALLMLLVAWRLWRSEDREEDDGRSAALVRRPLVAAAGLGVGALSGFFGIGGGFLAVPALWWTARLDMRKAIGTSLMAVASFGFATAFRYGMAGKLDWPIASVFVIGGVLAGIAGTILGARVAKRSLRLGFAALLVPLAAYMAYRNLALILG